MKELREQLMQDLLNGERKPLPREEKYIKIAQQVVDASVEQGLNNEQFKYIVELLNAHSERSCFKSKLIKLSLN